MPPGRPAPGGPVRTPTASCPGGAGTVPGVYQEATAVRASALVAVDSAVTVLVLSCNARQVIISVSHS